MKNQIDLKEVYDFARKAHAGQRYAEDSYITHPMLVALMVDTPLEKAVALLHDTVEDTYVTVKLISINFGNEVAQAVEVLTNTNKHPTDEQYEQYIISITKNLTALKVKIADLKCNLFFCQRRAEYFSHIPRYEKALAYLTDIAMPIRDIMPMGG